MMWTSRSGSGQSMGWNRTPFNTLNTVVLAPIPSASERMITAANPR